MLNVGNYVKITFVLQDMPIGYKCINSKDIARIVMEMLRASVEQTGLLILLLNAKKKNSKQNILHHIFFSFDNQQLRFGEEIPRTCKSLH